MAAQRPAVRAAFDALRSVEVPVVAAVAGYALGGSFELALSCDLIVADTSAVVGLPEVSVGLVPGGGGLRLGAGSGLAAALEVEDAAWREAAGSPDREEGIRAFVEKRSPAWPSQAGRMD